MSEVLAEEITAPVAPKENNLHLTQRVHYLRIVAWLIDTEILLGIFTFAIADLLYETLAPLGSWNAAIGFSIGVAYLTIMPWLMDGSTPGMKVIRARFVNRDGNVPPFWQLALRSVLAVAIFTHVDLAITSDRMMMRFVFMPLGLLSVLSVFFYIFGWKLCRLPHDYLSGTRIQRIPDDPAPPAKTSTYVIAAVLILVVAAFYLPIFSSVSGYLIPIVGPQSNDEPAESDRDSESQLEDVVREQLGALSVIIYDSEGGTHRVMGMKIETEPATRVSVEVQAPLTAHDVNRFLYDAVSATFEAFPDNRGRELLDVNIESDLNLVFHHKTEWISAKFSVSEWKGYLGEYESNRDTFSFPVERLDLD